MLVIFLYKLLVLKLETVKVQMRGSYNEIITSVGFIYDECYFTC